MTTPPAPDFDQLPREQLLEAVREMHSRLVELETRLDQAKMENRWLEGAIAKRTRELNERVKELHCLYEVSAMLDSEELSPGILQQLADSIPKAWQFPRSASARILIRGAEFLTKGFRETEWMRTKPIAHGGTILGRIDVAYPRDCSEGGKLFLPEEDSLLDEIARRLGRSVGADGARPR